MLVGMVQKWGKSTRKYGEQSPYAFLGKFGGQEIESSSKMTRFAPKSKNELLFTLWLETKMFVNNNPSTLVNFINWLGSH